MIHVVELVADSTGWRALLPEAVFGVQDLDAVPSLDGFHPERAPVQVDGEWVEMSVYRRGTLAYVRVDELPQDGLDD